ncbi:MAG: hypothetical protein HY695_04620 [Deltaproteobacteria bacterium]|nr:hypothetical protein [Deltaproteobacteria bacterium]
MLSKTSAFIPLEDAFIGARFLAGLPSFLRRGVKLDEAKLTVLHRLENRQTEFLAIARKAIYPFPESPYRQLLKLIGCELEDLEKLVRQNGVEDTLRILYRHGVYLTVDEFKGRRPVVRGSACIPVDPNCLRNPVSAARVPSRSGGSRSAGTPVLFDFAFIRDCAVDTCLALHTGAQDG